MKKLICLLISLLFLLNIPCITYAKEKDENIKAKAVVLMAMDTGEVLYQENEYKHLSPASVTKIMSILLVLEALDSEKIKLTDKVTASKDAVSMGGSQIWLEQGEIMTVDELLKAVVVASANDACTALGEYVAGSSLGFVKMMNSKAKELGLIHTNFENCTGLDDSVKNHYSCAYDLAVIASQVMNYDIIKNYSTIWLDGLRDGKTELNNTNKLVKTYNGITGLKTGTTSNAGFCVAATASRDNLNLVAVVLGSDTSEDRFNTASYLLDYGFANYQCVIPKINDKKIKKIAVNGGKNSYVNLFYNKTKPLVIEKNNNDLKYKYKIKKEVNAPIKKGQQLGKIEVLSTNKVISTIPLCAKENVDKVSIKFIFWRLFRKI